MDKAALSTDGRYFNQASKQLDDNWLLLKQGVENVPTWQEWYVFRYGHWTLWIDIFPGLPRKPSLARSSALILVLLRLVSRQLASKSESKADFMQLVPTNLESR